MANGTNSALVAFIARQIMRGADAVLDAVPTLTPVMFGKPTERPEHMRPVAEFFASVARGECRRLVMSSAPRFGKSETIVHSIAWTMLCRPGLRVVLVSCTQFLAEQLSTRVRALLPLLSVGIARDQNRADMWTAQNGSSLRAVGVGTALVGIGADCLVIDDLVPSMEAANSPTACEKAEEWFESTALGRLEPSASVLVNMHRWSLDDLSSRLIGEGWPWANVPALNAQGESNWPSRWTTDALKTKRTEVGELVWSALYQGMPRPRGGAVFVGGPHFYDPAQVMAHVNAGAAHVAIGVDPAATASTSADYSVILVAAFITEYHALPKTDEPRAVSAYRAMVAPRRDYIERVTMNVLDVIRMQVEIPDLVARIAEVQRYWRAPVGVESVGAFKGVGQYLRRAGAPVHDIRRTTDKLTASIPASAAWARGDIRVPPDANERWPFFLAEVMRFTGTGADRHEDAVDALTICHSLYGLALHAERRERRRAALLPFA